jgi:hypothetical protein
MLADSIRKDMMEVSDSPYSDARGTVKTLADWVKKGAGERGLVDTTGICLMPANFEGGPKSWLRTPFIAMKRAASGRFRDCAGNMLAKYEISEYKDREVFVADTWELTTIELAVLRQLGIEASFGFLHYNPEENRTAKTPCVVLTGRDDRVPVEFILPPGIVASLAKTASALEVLDQRALLTLIYLKETLAGLKSLMHETKFGDVEGVGRAGRIGRFSNQDKEEAHAIQLGHVFSIVENTALRTECLDDDDDVGTQRSLGGNKTLGAIAKEYLHYISCPTCQNNMAILEIIGQKEAPKLPTGLLHSTELKLEDIQLITKINGEVLEMFRARLAGYMGLWKLMLQHNHSETECPNIPPI